MTYVAFNTYDEHDWRSGNPTYDDLAYEKEFYCRVCRHLLEWDGYGLVCVHCILDVNASHK